MKCVGLSLLATFALTIGATNAYVVVNAYADEGLQQSCPINKNGDTEICTAKNSKLPLGFGKKYDIAEGYTCLNLKYKGSRTGKTYEVYQCALKAEDGDLCDVLKKRGDKYDDCHTQEPTGPDDQTTKSDDQTTKSDDQTTKSDDQTTKSDDQTTKSDDQTTKSDDQTTNDDQTTKSDGQTTKSDDQTTKSDDQTTKSDDQTTKSDDQTTKSDDQTTKSDDQTTKSDDQTTKSDDQTTKSDDQTTKSDDQTTKSDDQTTKSDDQTTKSDDQTTTSPTSAPGSGQYCYSSVAKKVVECNAENSKLDKDIKIEGTLETTAQYVCLDVKLKGILLIPGKEIQQCALQLKDGADICKVIQNKKSDKDCHMDIAPVSTVSTEATSSTSTQETPSTTPGGAASLTSNIAISTLLVLIVYYLK